MRASTIGGCKAVPRGGLSSNEPAAKTDPGITIGHGLDEVEKSQEELWNTISEFEQRLAPIMPALTSPGASTDDIKEDANVSHTVFRLAKMRAVSEAQISYLNRIMNRVQL